MYQGHRFGISWYRFPVRHITSHLHLTHPRSHNSRQLVRVAAGLAAIGTGGIVMCFQRLEILADADGAIVQPKLTAVCDYLSTPEGL